jgi:ribosomal protein S18 acetylase RimI-like enzyme
MKATRFRAEPLADGHDRSAFDCGDETLNRYLRTQVSQDIRRHIANCFVAVEVIEAPAGGGTSRVAAYYTLSAASLPFTDLPAEESKRLPRYPTIPAVRIGRLAVDRQFQRCGLGAAMLADATVRALKADAAAFMLVVDAKNEQAVKFYEKFGFRLVAGMSRTLFLPLATARKVFAQG